MPCSAVCRPCLRANPQVCRASVRASDLERDPRGRESGVGVCRKARADLQFTIGDGADDRFAQQLVKRLGMRDAVSIETKRHTASGDVKRVTEEMPVVQSKLVMALPSAPRRKSALRQS